MFPRLFADVCERVVLGPGILVHPIVDQRVPDVDDREQARGERNPIRGDTPGIAGAVPLLVMAEGNVDAALKVPIRLRISAPISG